ncbi:MAG: CoA transferase [Deltaproteobacteria bacterium]|nr:CoA transferase [Deltaproteobacteria bacterium]
MPEKALNGVKIADFSWVAAGPCISTFLAAYGATVIKIESTKVADMGRTIPPFKDKKPGLNRSGAYALFNSNKYGVTLNMKSQEGLELAKKIISWSDMVIENFTPKVMKSWGLSYEEIIKFKPDIIMLSSSMVGQDGPRANQPGFGGQLTGMCGFTQLCGWEDRVPVRPASAYTDIIGPKFGAAALMASLISRLKTGKGQYFDLSQFEACLYFIAPAVMDYTANHRIAERRDNMHPVNVPHGAYQCRGDDKWCVISVSNDYEWRQLCQAMEKPMLVSDPRFLDRLSRKKNEKDLNKIITEWTKSMTANEVMIMLQNSGVPAGMVKDMQELRADPQLNYRGHFQKTDHPEMGEYTTYLPAFRLSKTPPVVSMPAPCLGEHNHYVCTEILGVSDEDFLALDSRGVFK